MSDEAPVAPYRFQGLPLTPTVFGDLLVELAPGELLRRRDAIALVRQHHEVSGGRGPTGDIVSVAKKALTSLAESGAVSPAGTQGFYRVVGLEAVLEVDATAVSDEEDDEISTLSSDTAQQSVYAYYLPAYKMLAEQSGFERWPHKIGMTIGGVAERIKSQAGTALPERPELARVFACDNAALLERAIHSVLALRGQRVNDAPGTEWFVTSVAEIEEIVRFTGWTEAPEDDSSD